MVEEQADNENLRTICNLKRWCLDKSAAEEFVRGKGLTTGKYYVEEVDSVKYIHVKQHIAGKSTKEVVKNLSSGCQI